ncbi:MAG TPA: transcriptional regulator [Ktedonobacter sp.]|jgi:transcriptional regulator with XRE-family HTH domain|nr:transcriptional regulator [Ktedonobacter sp.]HAG97697.1 transcriptional regulator [Ktedonobacter sp.]HAT43607.1 transcriptional regulator [Ktedonobacter sp.]HBE26840.1 transcriptional regulator [Ktedonobacter sp.]HCF87603.1 transcriptional regulator [Ktedonobacter sp.]
MDLSEKIKHLREVEGELRGYNRPMTQIEVVKAMQEELNESISQAYLSQLEKGKRVHLTATSRILLANFFKVHPSYLVSDPPDYSTDLLTDMVSDGDRFERWLIASAAEWHTDPEIYSFFQHLSSVDNPRQYLAVFEQLLHEPVEELEHMVHSYNPNKENGAR